MEWDQAVEIRKYLPLERSLHGQQQPGYRKVSVDR
jgi:hypothetical protein